MVFPHSRIFASCDEVNRILKYIPFEIILTRTANNSHCYFSVVNTAIDFPDHDYGITSLTLQRQRIKFCPDIASDLENLD